MMRSARNLYDNSHRYCSQGNPFFYVSQRWARSISNEIWNEMIDNHFVGCFFHFDYTLKSLYRGMKDDLNVWYFKILQRDGQQKSWPMRYNSQVNLIDSPSFITVMLRCCLLERKFLWETPSSRSLDLCLRIAFTTSWRLLHQFVSFPCSMLRICFSYCFYYQLIPFASLITVHL